MADQDKTKEQLINELGELRQRIAELEAAEAERKRAEKAAKLNESRLEALLELGQMAEASLEQIADYVLEEVVELTRSKVGFLVFLDEDETSMTLHAGSKQVMEECSIEHWSTHFLVDEAGIWGEAVRQRRPIVINDYAVPNPHKKGYPDGHVHLLRLMSVPAFEGDRIVAVAIVGNKEEEYDETDVRQITLLANGMSRLVQRKRAEEALRRLLEKTARGQRLLLALSQASQAVQRARTPEEVYRTIGDEIAGLGYHATIFTLIDDGTRLAASYLTFKPALLRTAEKLTGLSVQNYRFPLEAGGLYERIIEQGKAVFSDRGAGLIAEALPGPVRWLARQLADVLGIEKVIYAPLKVGGETHSIMTVIGADLTEADVPAVMAFASQAEIAIENAELYLATQEELTARKRAEASLRESEERYRTLVETSPDAISLTDLSGRFLAANRQSLELYGFDSLEELQASGRTVFDFVIEQEQQRALENAQKVLEDGFIRDMEYTTRRKDGTTFPTEISSSVILGADGSPRAFMGLSRDITERKRAEEERERLLVQIRGQAQRMQQVLDAVPEGVLLLDAGERIILVNPMAERDLVVLADAKTGDTLTHLGDHPLAELLTSPPKGLWHEVVAGSRVFQAIARPIEDGPTPDGWVVVIRDVTQQREIDQRVQQQERLAAVGQLAAGIAHDFNNIMAAIVLYAQMTARMEGLPAVVRERMETIDGQAKHATNLIQQVLDFSRRAVLERRPLDLAILLKEHVRLLERTLPESIEIKLDCEPDEYTTPFTVNADPTRMQQMVTNLALNARDAMRSGGELSIRLERVEVKPKESPLLPEMTAGEWARMTVSDTGTGIPPDALPHIFEPFFTTKTPLGSGLGLAQVHGIVGAHEGRIDVATQVGKGTTFTIYLPVYLSEPSPVLSSTELSALPTGQGETILVVEDDAVVQQALADGLELLNYQVRKASNGQEALAVLEGHKGEIALVLSDVVMPQMGGITLLHALKEQGLAVPVVMLTGHAVQGEMEELRAQGMRDWLPKPPRLEELAEVVARALNAD
jgi:two-component system cell cycle sensor histidine kinase/response regulator CckA